jgi:signal transduction histidine kinase
MAAPSQIAINKSRMSVKNFIGYPISANWYYHGFAAKGQSSIKLGKRAIKAMNDTDLNDLRNAFRALSHDIRSPLTSILGLAEITLEDPSLSEDTRENLMLLAADAERLTELTMKAIEDIEVRFFSARGGTE